MEEKIAQVLYLYEDLEQEADENFVYDILSILVREYNINNIIKNVEINNGLSPKEDGRIQSGVIHIRLNPVTLQSSYFDYNLSVLHVLLHEVNHAIIDKELLDGRNDLFAKMLYYGITNPDYDSLSALKVYLGKVIYDLMYYFNHDNFPDERRVEISSLIKIKGILNKLLMTDLNEEMIKTSKAKYNTELDLLELGPYDYKKHNITNSPSFECLKYLIQDKDSMFEELEMYKHQRNESNKEIINNYTMEDRLLYGLQLTNDEYNNLLENSILNSKYNELTNKKMLIK